jgi:hypothetical protein
MKAAAEAGTDLVEPDELRATTQENAAQEESPDPVQVQDNSHKKHIIVVCMSEKISIEDKMTKQNREK